MAWPALTQREITIMWNMRNKLKLKVADITRATGRDKSTIYKIFRPRRKKPKQRRPGRDCLLNRKVANHVVKTSKNLINMAQRSYEITWGMLKAEAKSSEARRTMRNTLHQRKIYFLRNGAHW